jgi:hypothetical protein
MTKLLTIAALVCLVAPAALAVPPPGQGSSASTVCKQQRNTIGMNAFRLLYAPTGTPKAAMDACLAGHRSIESIEAKNAAKTCRAERGTTPASIAAFNERWGTGNKKNAMGKCVSATRQEEVAEHQHAVLNAAKQCKTERGTTQATITAFNNEHGTNANKKNAFGKCVSKLVKESTS